MGDPLTEAIIGAAIEVHRHLGPGLLESIYEEALCIEMELRGIPFRGSSQWTSCIRNGSSKDKSWTSSSAERSSSN